MTASVAIIGGGLAGSEAALQLAKAGISVDLYEMKPAQRSPAHHNPNLAEIVCSNSFGSHQSLTASSLLKAELLALDCQLLQLAQSVSVPAGQALAVDRDAFSQLVNDKIQQTSGIQHIVQEVSTLPEGYKAYLIATGPMTSAGLSQTLSALVNRQQLYFFDAAAPIVLRDSIDFSIAFYQNRYEMEKKKADESDAITAPTGDRYINCPLNKEEYTTLRQFILDAEKIPLKSFETAGENGEKAQFFESCLPVEVLADRGEDTLRYGPLKPVGLYNPHRNGERPYAVVQLRQDNLEGTLFNMVGFQTNLRWGAQKQMIQLIPGLQQAEVVRYGVMHRNTYLHSPEVLQPSLQLKEHPHIFIAGQLTGTEGYTESIATGLLAAKNVERYLNGASVLVLPAETMLGALTHYITRPEAIGKNFQPINSNWGILPAPSERIKDKKLRHQALYNRALAELEKITQSNQTLGVS
ncbi:MAG: methylenetetrahydrofolate--tRNA-(uracil(54)-C(5))-methyltransferase (FADH(2)-oxidizing) TrmFO [Candidatus Melainabacteria bacterium]|nr:methylenetetrahydrofolate--tRNA-(uracil(54)-C(5))-methyltransferase (FADH(2)-oxidizing) TrmFO [Candidatus Melainabacteria bacterium]